MEILNDEIRFKFRIIFFHQRGWGRSKIEGGIFGDISKANEAEGTTDYPSVGIDANIADCEKLRIHFKIDKWAVVYGGSIIFSLIIDNTPINRQFPNIKQFHTISYFMMQI